MHTFYFLTQEEVTLIGLMPVILDEFNSNLIDCINYNFGPFQNITLYPFFEFNAKLKTITTNQDLIIDSYNRVISNIQLEYNRYLFIREKSLFDKSFYHNPQLGNEIFYNLSPFGKEFYYVLNDLHHIHPIRSHESMKFYSDWYNSRYPVLLGKECTENRDFIVYSRDFFKEQFLLKKIASLKMDFLED